MAAMEEMALMKSVVYESLRIEPPVALQYGRAKRDFVIESHDAARTVILNKDLTGADGIAVRSDGVVVAVSQHKAYYIKSLKADLRVYVLYGHVKEGMLGNVGREEFGIVEIESRKESGEESLWVYLLIGLALAYFFFWRFQMKQLVTNMNKKTA